MENKIKAQIEELEKKYGIEVLFACETGSRAWGFPSPDSDYDVRLIYKHPIDWYLSLSDKKDSIELMADDGELDFTGWDIKKCLKLMWKSNASIFERLQSPIAYKEVNDVSSTLMEYATRCYSPVATMHHYLGLALNSFSEVEGRQEIKLKKLFYALRATLACKWILEKNEIPPMLFQTMVDELEFDPQLKERISVLVTLKATKNEDYMHPQEGDLSAFIAQELNEAKRLAVSLKGRAEKEVDLDALFLNIIKGN